MSEVLKYRKLLLLLMLICFSPSLLAASTMSQSSNPASQSIGGTTTFTCDYRNSSGSISNSQITFTLKDPSGAVVSTQTKTGGSPLSFDFTFGVDSGIYQWYCHGHDNDGINPDVDGAWTSYTVNAAYCNIGWSASGADAIGSHYAQQVNTNVRISVELSGGTLIAGQNPEIWTSFAGPIYPAPSGSIATATFTLPQTAGQYDVSATAPLCLSGAKSAPDTISNKVNAYHGPAAKIVVTDPIPPTITKNQRDNFDISIEIQDSYGNICDGSFDGTVFTSTNSSPTVFEKSVGIYQDVYNTSGLSVSYNPKECTLHSNSNCFFLFNATHGAKATFNLTAYSWPVGETLIGIDNFPKEVTATIGSSYATLDFVQSGTLTDPKVTMNYTPPPTPQANRFLVTLIQPSIKVNDSFNITIQAIFPNSQIDTGYNNKIRIYRDARSDISLPSTEITDTELQVVAGNVTYEVDATKSRLLFNITGVYTITAVQTTPPIAPPNSMQGSASLSVSSSGIDYIDVVVDPTPIFTSLLFKVTATMKDATNNTITDFAGEANLTCPSPLTFPVNKTENITTHDLGVVVFSDITANASGNVVCNITAFDSVNNVVKLQSFTVVMITPAACVNYTIPPTPTIAAPVDTVVSTSYTPPVHDVMENNLKIGDTLIGYDPATGTMNGNYSICLESYYTGTMCFNSTDIQFDKAPVSVCVKEFIYNPEADLRISDHLNYNGVDDLEDTFKHPEILWGWGYKNFSGVTSACSGSDKYEVNFRPGQMYTDYFNVTVTLPFTSLEPYNITNDSILNPHELRAPEALLVVDHKDNGRLAKFDLDAPATWREDYNGLKDGEPIPGATSLIGANAQSISYDNRDNIFVAISNAPKINVLRMARMYPPTIHFITEINIITSNGTKFFPYAMDSDSWGNLYVLGNTRPDAPNNTICINVYNKDFELNVSNNCSENFEGTARDITVNEEGSSIFIVRDKQMSCFAGVCGWIGDPLIYQYNASNPSQRVANISILGEDAGLLWLSQENPGDWIIDSPCTTQDGSKIIQEHINESGDWHYLRGIKYRKGYLFVVDYMTLPQRQNYFGCIDCLGCCVPGCLDLGILGKIGCYQNNGSGCTQDGGCLWCPDPSNCDACLWYDINEYQQTRLLALDTVGAAGKYYRARTIIEPKEYVTLWKAWYDPWGILSRGLQYVSGQSSETHGIDVDEHFNVYIALKGKRNSVVRYMFQIGVPDSSLNFTGSSYSFNPINDWNNPMTDNVSLPDDVIGYPDMIKEAMMAGVSCEGCSLEGAVEPAVCMGEVEKTNTSQYSNIESMLSSGTITPGSPMVHITSPLTPVYRRNFLSTNITAFLRFDYDFDITKITNGCGAGPTSSSTATIHKQLNITSYSNNLERLVEGGGAHFTLTRPTYPEKPATIPNTLPYLAYDYLTNRFFYKHFPMLDNVEDLMGSTADKEWILNSSYRKTFQILKNQYYAYEYMSTTPTVDYFGTQTTLYGLIPGDPDAADFIKPPPGLQTIPLNNTMDWSYPFAYVFSPFYMEPNPLPFTPQDAPVPPAMDYTFLATTNVSALQVSILCENSSGVNNTFTAQVTNGTYTLLGVCKTIYAISAAGAWEEASLLIVPENLSLTNAICFESLFGANSSLCRTTQAWFKKTIPPNTVVSQTSYDKEIASPTRYPMLGEPYASFPSSIKIVPVKMSGPTMLTIRGSNVSRNLAIPLENDNSSGIAATADMMGTQLPNPLPIRNLSTQTIYFHSDINVSFVFLMIDPTGATGSLHGGTVNYTPDQGWVPIAGVGTAHDYTNGFIYDIHSVICDNGCLLEFANDSTGMNSLGKLYLWTGWGVSGIPLEFVTGYQGSDKYPAFTFQAPKGEVQFVTDDPMNRDFMSINSVTGSGYLGDQFKVYTDPELIINIDNLTANSNGTAMHPSGPPCTPSFVCPKIELSLFNESLEVASTKDHNSNNNTVITIVGTDDDPAYNLIKDSVTLGNGMDYPSMTFTSFIPGNRYSNIYIIEVLNATKGESIIFRTATTKNEVARIYIPSENYVTKSSIGTILPRPRRLKISSDNPTLGRSIEYIIRGTRGNTELVTESTSGTTNVECSITGPSTVQDDPMLNGCEFQFDKILTPQSTGTAFNLRIRAVPQNVTPPGWVEILTFLLPIISNGEDIGVCDSTSAQSLLWSPDGIGTCMTHSPPPPPPPPVLTYPFTDPANAHSNNPCSGIPASNIVGAPDDVGACIHTLWGAWILPSFIFVKSDTPLNLSGLNIPINTSPYPSYSPQSLEVRMSSDPSCDTLPPALIHDNFPISYSFTPQSDNDWHDNIINFSPLKYQNIHCIAIFAPFACFGPLCDLASSGSQNFSIDAVGIYEEAIPSTFVAVKFNSPLNITGFNVTAKNVTPINTGNPFTILASDDPGCFSGNAEDDADPALFHWQWTVNVPLQATGNWQDNVITAGPFQNVQCLAFEQTDPGVKWYIDSVGVYLNVSITPPEYNCDRFNGNITLVDSTGRICPAKAGPFFNGVWSGRAEIPVPGTDVVIRADNGNATGLSNAFNVTATSGSSLVSFITTKAYTHVLSIEIHGDENESFNVTTAPLNLDEPPPLRSVEPEQIGTISIVPNDFVLGFYQNRSGTYIYSQRDSVILNIPDNKSLGLHDFEYRFYDRFNNTFIVPYTIWLRQPTAIILDIQTVRDPANLNLTQVYVTAQLLYQRYDRPDEKPSIPIGEGIPMELYVQNSTLDKYGDGNQTDPTGCNPATLGVCPILPEESNCSCPDWIDDPASPGDCIPNPSCHQYGRLSDLATGDTTFYTNGSGHITTTFKIYGFGRRLLFAVFWGTDIYAPSIQIQPFYAGGMSIAMGRFLVLEPLLLITISLAILTVKRKFMLRT